MKATNLKTKKIVEVSDNSERVEKNGTTTLLVRNIGKDGYVTGPAFRVQNTNLKVLENA